MSLVFLILFLRNYLIAGVVMCEIIPFFTIITCIFIVSTWFIEFYFSRPVTKIKLSSANFVTIAIVNSCRTSMLANMERALTLRNTIWLLNFTLSLLFKINQVTNIPTIICPSKFAWFCCLTVFKFAFKLVFALPSINACTISLVV